MTEAQLEMWRSALIEDTMDYLEDHEDYVVITVDEKTGDIIQQYEYEYSLDRFLEHLASLQDLNVRSILPKLEDVTLKRRNEVDQASSRGDSPHTDPEFKDLDAISHPDSNGESWMTYSDSGSEMSSEVMRERAIQYRDREHQLDGSSSGSRFDKRNEQCGHELVLPTVTIIAENKRQDRNGVGNEQQDEGRASERGRRFRDIGMRDGLALAATANAVLLACMWIAERWERVEQR